MAKTLRPLFCMLFVVLIATATSWGDAGCSDYEMQGIMDCINDYGYALQPLANDLSDSCNTKVIQDNCGTLGSIATCMKRLDLPNGCVDKVPDVVNGLLNGEGIACRYNDITAACPYIN